MSRRLRYQVAVSLDGFIAGPHGEHDWIVMDPSIDFIALFREFDTAVNAAGGRTRKRASARSERHPKAGSKRKRSPPARRKRRPR